MIVLSDRCGLIILSSYRRFSKIFPCLSSNIDCPIFHH